MLLKIHDFFLHTLSTDPLSLNFAKFPLPAPDTPHLAKHAKVDLIQTEYSHFPP